MLSGRPIAVRFTKMIADSPRQTRVGVSSKDDNISDHNVRRSEEGSSFVCEGGVVFI